MQISSLDAVIAIALLNDPFHRPCKVEDCPLIPKEPKLTGKTSHSIFNKQDVIIKELKSWLISTQNGSLHQLVSKFWEFNNGSIEATLLIPSFEHFLSTDSKMSINDEHYYINLIQFIDLLLTFKSPDSEKKKMLSKRQSILQLSFVPLPDIHDPKMREIICKLFAIDETTLFISISSIQNKIMRSDVVTYIQSNGLSKKYTSKDFDSEIKYSNWMTETKALEQSIIREFGSKSNNTSFPYIPTNLLQAVTQLSEMILNADPKFLKLYMDCLRIWQFDPFQLQFIFLNIVSPSTGSTDLTKFAMDLNKAIGLALTCAPIQVEFNDWPIQHKRQILMEGMKIYNSIKSQLDQNFNHFFEDQKSFTNSLVIVKQLKLTSNDLGVRVSIKEKLATALKERSDIYYKKANIQDPNAQKLTFDQMATYLTVVSRDINLLYNWKIMNGELNTSFGVYEYGSKILMTPVLKFVKDFVSNFKSQTLNGTNFINSDTRQSFSSFLDRLNSLKDRTGFNFDFQSELFDDFIQLVHSWNSELQTQVLQSIKQDPHLSRDEGASSSKSAKNVRGILDGYINLLDSFQWKDKSQRAQLEVQMYRMISNGIDTYSHHMFTILLKNLSNVVDLKSDACTSLNNLMVIKQYLDTFKEKKSLNESCEILKTLGLSKLKSPKKFVSINIKSAENVEDAKGGPISLKVAISGIKNGITRFIYKDYTPEWFEEFNGFVKDSSLTPNLKLTIISVDDKREEKIYKSINYNIDLTRETKSIEDKKLSLAPKAGKLIISTSVEFEKNDPLFYIEKSKSMIERDITRAIKLFVDEYTMKMKDIFSKEYLDTSLSQAPVSSNNINYQRLMDLKLNEYTSSMRNMVIPEMFNNLDESLFNKIVQEIWSKVIQRAEDLLLPRLSSVDNTIIKKLNKRMSSSISAGDRSKYRTTTKEEVIRVIEWCFKFREMLDIPMIRPDIQLEFNKELDRLNNIRQLTQLTSEELNLRYYHSWNYISHKIIDKKLKIQGFDEFGWESAQKDKSLVCRVLFARGESRQVKKLLEIERRFERTINTEIEVQYKT